MTKRDTLEELRYWYKFYLSSAIDCRRNAQSSLEHSRALEHQANEFEFDAKRIKEEIDKLERKLSDE